jgi:hypothetical protein
MYPTQMMDTTTQKPSLLASPNRKSDERGGDEQENFVEISMDFEAGSQLDQLDDINAFVKKYMNDDFNAFFAVIKLEKCANLVLLIERIINHFLETRNRDLPKRLEELSCFSFSQGTLRYCPSFLISDEIKEILVKLYLYASHFCKELITNPLSNLTLFEIMSEYYTALIANPEISAKKKQKILFIRKKLSQFAFSFLNDALGELDLPKGSRELSILRIRAYHILALYFLQKEFENPPMVRQCLFHLDREISSFQRSFPEEGDQVPF